MSSSPRSTGDDGGRLHRCIRDLVALHALPSMCVGRSADEALRIVLEALPTALGCELVYLSIPGVPPKDVASWRGETLTDAQLAMLRAAIAVHTDDACVRALFDAESVWWFEAELPVGRERGRLIAGRVSPLDGETDRVLVRTAANLVGTALETAVVLESAHRKDEFLAMLGHELRNPLAPILTAVELLARHPLVAREQQVIERNTRHLTRLVDDLLDISRVTRGHIELRREHVSLRSVLDRAVEIAAPLIARNRHALRIGSTDDAILEGDPVRLAQIFGNLLTNAAKFTPPGGAIDVSIDRSRDRLRIRVRDSGRGIAPEQLDNIFRPFVQVDRHRDALRGGLGLGLAIVSNLVERHGGSITAQSDGLSHGATFTVDLPCGPPPDMQTAIEWPPQAPTARHGVRVLVVDDNVDIAELLSLALELEGFQTAIAHDGHTALQRWRTFAPHAGVLDVGLPELDGYEVARTLRTEHGSTPLLIAATGYGEASDRLRATDAGFDCHFVKPVSIAELAQVLDKRVIAARASAVH